MDRLQTEDGHHFVRSLAQFIRQHEKALANSLQLSVHRRQSSLASNSTNNSSVTSGTSSTSTTNSTGALAAAFSFAGLNFRSHAAKAALLTLTPHHLFYLLSQMEELDITVGPMNVRLESLNNDPSPSNYVSFLQAHKPAKGRSDRDSIHSVSSMRSVMSGMTTFWSSIGLGGGTNSKSDKVKALTQADLTYLYSAFTKLPSLRLTTDHRARLITGYEEFPFDTAVPLFAFKNLQQLDIVDLDFRQFFGWDRLAEQLTLLTLKRANLVDPTELLTNIVLDDAEKRRRRSSRNGRGSVTPTSSWTMPSTPRPEYAQSYSDPGSPADGSLDNEDDLEPGSKEKPLSGSVSPKRLPSRPSSSYRHVRTYSSKVKRSGSGSSNSSEASIQPHRSDSSSSLLTLNILPPSKWQRLKYLSLADNSLTTISAKSLAPVATTLRSLNLSSNLFTEIPDGLASLTRLVSLDLSNCMIGSLQSLTRSPLPAVLTVNLKANRLRSLAGVERLLSLEQLNIQDNQLSDPMEMARLTCIPNLKRIWVKRNPFTKSHSEYRVTTFNLFRQTPGYVDDIVIDESGPGYTERKQLVDRAPEVERQIAPPSIRIAELPVVIHQSEQAASAPAEPPEVSRNPSRRKKAPRRRIVDLANDEGIARVPDEDIAATIPAEPVLDSLNQQASAASRDPPEPPAAPADASGDDIYDGSTQAPSVGSNEPLSQDDDYRAKVEALRQEFGSNWLSALGDMNWHNSHHLEISQGEILGHKPLHQSGHQVIVSGGRTLG